MQDFFLEFAEKLKARSVDSPNGSCRIWVGCLTKNGYGKLRYKDPRCGLTAADHKTVTANRMALFVKHQTLDVSSQLQASHLCDNKLCVNADHLYFETSKNNIERRSCFRMGRCNGHTDSQGNRGPPCLVHLREESSDH